MKIDASYLDQINEQIQQLEATMSQPEVSSDPNKMKQCMRDYAHQKKIANIAEQLWQLMQTIEESHILLKDADCEE